MADKTLELLLRIIAQVDGLRDVEGLRESVEQLDPALSNLAERAKAALNPMDGLANSAHNFGAAVKETTQPLSDLATTALKVTSIAAALATALGGAVYQEAKKFESAQLDLKKVLNGTQEELDIYGKKLNDLALQYGVSANALTASMAAFVQAGFDADAALNLVAQSLKLKVAGDMEAAESSDYLVRMLKGFNAEAADSARFVDVLNEVSNRYATDVKQLAEGMSRVAPIAKQMGLSFEDTAGVLTPMIESFGSGAEAAEAFKTGVLKLIDDSVPVKDALRSIGVAQTDANGALRSGKDILNDVMVAFQRTGQEQKLYITSQLVGIDQAPRLIEAFDSLNKVLGIQKAGLEAAGSAQAEVNIRLQSAETIGNRTAESFRQLAVALGTNYRNEVKGVVDATGALARGFLEAEKAGSMDGLFAAVKPQLEAVESLFRQMAANLPAAFAQLDFTPLTSAITDLGGEVSAAFRSFMGSIDLSTVDGLRQLLQYLADSMAALIRFTAGAVEQMTPFFSALGKLAQFAAENADSVARMAGEVAGFGFTVNKLLPLIADFAAGTFSIIGTASEAALKIGLLVGAVKLLNLAGIEVLPILGRLALAIGSLNLSTATIAAAFAGVPGVILALGAAAGTAGYAVGTVLSAGINTAAEAITGTSLGGLIYDLAESLGLENTEADRAKIAQDQLAAARERQAIAAKQQAEAQHEQELAAARAAKAQEEQIALAGATDKANRLLAAGFQESGLIWNAATGELARVSDVMSGIAPASLTVKNALNELGVDYAKFSGGISQNSEKAVQSFKKITEDVTTNAPIIASALSAAVNKAETIGDLEAIQAAFKRYAETGKLSAEQVAAAQEVLSKKFVELNQAQDPALQNLNALAASSSQYVRAVQGVVNAETDGTKAAISLAKAKGDTAEVQRLTIKLTLQEADGAVRIAQARQAEQEAEAALAKKKLELAKILREKNQITAEDLMLAELTAQKEVAEAEAAQKDIELKQRQQQQAEKMAGPIGALIRLYEQSVIANTNEANAIERNYANKIRDLDTEIKIAEAKGDSVKASALKIEKAQAEADMEAALAEAKNRELDAEINLIEAKKLSIPIDEQITKAGKEKIAALDEEIAKLRAAQEANRDKAAAAQADADATKAAAEATKSAGDATEKANAQNKESSKGLTQISKSMWELTDAAKAWYDQQIKLGAGTAFGYLGDMKRGFDSAAASEKDAASASKELQDAWAQMQATGDVNIGQLRSLIDRTEQASAVSAQYGYSVTKAGEEAIAELRSLEKQWNELADTIESRNADLRAQLAELQGDKSQADTIRNETDLTNSLKTAELELQLARTGGNTQAIAEAQQNLLLIRQIYEAKQEQIDQEARAARNKTASNNATNNTTTNNTTKTVVGSGGASTSGGITLNINAGSAQLLDANFADALARQLKPRLDAIARRSA